MDLVCPAPTSRRGDGDDESASSVESGRLFGNGQADGVAPQRAPDGVVEDRGVGRVARERAVDGAEGAVLGGQGAVVDGEGRGDHGVDHGEDGQDGEGEARHGGCLSVFFFCFLLELGKATGVKVGRMRNEGETGSDLDQKDVKTVRREITSWRDQIYRRRKERGRRARFLYTSRIYPHMGIGTCQAWPPRGMHAVHLEWSSSPSQYRGVVILG